MRRAAVAEKLAAAVGVVLAGATLATFSGVGGLGFVFDDWHYLHLNPPVARGLDWQGVSWAFTSFHSANWHPLTWLSHMLDVTLFGLVPAGPHIVNLLLHTANALLVFALLRSSTGAVWRPALVAALFALHPLRVESVAWIAERKDVLSAFFGLLTLAAYGRYVRTPGLGRAAAVAGCLALGLLAKPMLVTLPAALLLLDWWPLGRLRFPARHAGAPPGVGTAGPAWIVAEKIPLALLAAGAAWATLQAQRSAGALATLEALPLAARLANAAAAYPRYLAKALFPHDLSVSYPHGAWTPPLAVALAAVTALVLGAWRLRLRLPALTAGLLWYLGTLVPVIGLVQVGSQRLADRYTYLPQLGVAVAAAWAAAGIVRRPPALRRAAALAVAAGLVAFAAMARFQVRFWRDDRTLFEHALAVCPGNALAHNNLGNALRQSGDTAGAERHYREAVRISPGMAAARLGLGRRLAERGEAREAEEHLRAALAADPVLVDAHDALGDLLVAAGNPDGGIGHYRESLRLRPDGNETRERLAGALVAAGRVPEAVEVLRDMLRRAPENAAAHLNLGTALSALGRSREAEVALREALRIDPASAPAHRNLAVLLDDLGRSGEAVGHYREALRLAPGDTAVGDRLRELLAPGDPHPADR